MQTYNTAPGRVNQTNGLIGKAMGNVPVKRDPNKIEVKAHLRAKPGKSKGK